MGLNPAGKDFLSVGPIQKIENLGNQIGLFVNIQKQ